MLNKTDFDYFTEEHARPAFEDEQAIMLSGEPIVGKVEKRYGPEGKKDGSQPQRCLSAITKGGLSERSVYRVTSRMSKRCRMHWKKPKKKRKLRLKQNRNSLP